MGKHRFFLLMVIFIASNACSDSKEKKLLVTDDVYFVTESPLKYTDGFDYPVGKPNAKGYYNAQKFGENHHLGDDWNGVRGGNTDLGDPVYTVANGYVSFAENIGGGWGNVIRVVHYLDSTHVVESLYAHCDTIMVTKGMYLPKGTQIGTVGTNNGMYKAHLHFELREKPGMPVGPGYAVDTTGYTNPTDFIKRHRN